MSDDHAVMTDSVTAVMTGPDGQVKSSTPNTPDTPDQAVSTVATGD